jgi:hypothetical protein
MMWVSSIIEKKSTRWKKIAEIWNAQNWTNEKKTHPNDHPKEWSLKNKSCWKHKRNKQKIWIETIIHL